PMLQPADAFSANANAGYCSETIGIGRASIPRECERRHSGTRPSCGTFPNRIVAPCAAPAREPPMRISPILLAAAAGILLLHPGLAPLLAQQPAAQAPSPPGKPPGKFSVVTQTWHRYPGLAVADITFENGNDFGVRNAVVSCEFLAPKGKLLATGGSPVFQSSPPGKKKVEGIEFSLRERNAVPGSCRVISVSTTGGPNWAATPPNPIQPARLSQPRPRVGSRAPP